MQETQETPVQSLDWEDPLEKEMAAYSSTVAWKKSHGQRSLEGHSSRGLKASDQTEWPNHNPAQTHPPAQPRPHAWPPAFSA